MTNFVCPEHGAPVTWRGTGCPWCDHDHAERLEREQRRRQSRIDKRRRRFEDGAA
jgi:uncharacterized Zn finger protein (UPF0148 family)